MMKRRWMTGILAAALLAGCGQTGNVNPAQKLAGKYDLPSLGILVQNKSIARMEQSGTLQEWNAYMSDKYETSITVTADPETFEEIHLRLQNASEIYREIQAKSALPLDEYLKDNDNWNRLPEEFRKRFEYDGHLYGIPKSSRTTLAVSSIRTDWLEEAGLGMPRTMDELMEAGKKMLDHKHHLIGTEYAACIDLFNAFGLYFSDGSQPLTTRLDLAAFTKIKGSVPTAYDPLLDCYADAFFKPEAESALLYFQKMQNAGLISKDAFWQDTNYEVGSYGLYYGDPGYAKYRLSEAFEALPPLSTENPITYADDAEAYTLYPGTENPKAAVNFFVDMMFGSVDGYLDFSLGLPKTYSMSSNKVITRQYVNEMDKILYTPIGLADFDDMMLKDEYVVIGMEQDPKTERELQKLIRDYNRAYIDKYTKTGGLVKIPVWFSVMDNKSFLKARTVPWGGFGHIMMTMADPSRAIKEELALYRINAKTVIQIGTSPEGKIDYAGALRSLNAQIGKEFKQDLEQE